MVHFKQLGGPKWEWQLCRGRWRAHRRELSMVCAGLESGWTGTVVWPGHLYDGDIAAAGGSDVALARQQRQCADAAAAVYVDGVESCGQLVLRVFGAQRGAVSGP